MNLSKYISETTFYDKKEKPEKNKPKSWLKSVSAFANTNGGALIFGVSDNDRQIGLEDHKKDSELISEMIKTRMDPVPKVQLQNFVENGKHFIILQVEQGNETPYYLIDGGYRVAYKRVGNQSVVASSMDLKNLVLKGMNKTFDILATEFRSIDTTFNKLRIEYEKRTNKHFEEKDLFSFGLITKDDRLTYAGALFADDYLVYQSRVFCTGWDGLTKTGGRMEAIDDKEFEGNILFLLENALNFIKVNTKKMWKKGHLYREEFPDYPERAV
ncbi:MAG: putative DNA binding domain-containing protein [Peptostreptococcaceae bacterium]|nr:putative DNA binding domain-containing protein [Peptostreptococcaceae bacterium]